MQIQWYGQSAFRLTSPQATVVIDPFGDISALTSRGIQFDYPPIVGATADLVLITHEHGDHNAHDVVEGDPPVLRSTAGRLDSPIGEVTAVASEHDPAAGTHADRTRSSSSSSTAPGWPTSATSASAISATSRSRRSARSTC